tara:strand:- start:586 stop:1251 length:666 start_codon:yes stop_codon:yes gene_type:complete
MKSIGLFYALLYVSFSFGQAKADYSRIDGPISKIPTSANVSTAAIANYIQSKFTTPDDRIRAVFYWTTANISYDVANKISLLQDQLLEDRIAEVLSYNDRRINYVQEERSLEQLNLILKKYNEGVAELNQFIAFKNRQFKPLKNDNVIKNMILSPYDKLLWCQKLLGNLGQLSDANRQSVNGLQQSLNAALQMTIEHKNFVYQYVSKSPTSREKMFYKRVY